MRRHVERLLKPRKDIVPHSEREIAPIKKMSCRLFMDLYRIHFTFEETGKPPDGDD